MDHEERLDKLDSDIRDLLTTTARIDERVKSIQDALPKIKKEVVEQCQNDLKVWGIKSVSTLLAALVSSISALVLQLFNR